MKAASPASDPSDLNGRIRRFYDQWSPTFLEAAGDTFQTGLVKEGAEAREDPEVSTRLCGEAAGLQGGHRVLDAGCGVGGPSLALARLWPGITVDGVTLSPVQAGLAEAAAREAGLSDRARFHVADYHALPFADASFDRVFFFECTAYSADPPALYREVARVLRPGGRVYVKDVFRRDDAVGPEADAAMDAFDALWACARTRTLGEAAAAAAAAGFTVRTAIYPHVGVLRFLGAMIGAEGDLNTFGKGFLRTRAPILYGEVIGELRVP